MILRPLNIEESKKYYSREWEFMAVEQGYISTDEMGVWVIIL